MTNIDVLKVENTDYVAVEALLARYGLGLELVADGSDIPGSFWGESEAGLIKQTVFVRPDTPIHSLLHETCHYICMDGARRAGLHTDAGGDYDEENAVCYLQIILADEIPGMGKERMLGDMDRWGYTFRLGSSRRWFDEDADDARLWLEKAGLLESGKATYRLRR